METYKWQIKYIKWLSAEEMNEITKSWLSELNFIQDEQHFFEDLLVKFTSQLAKSDHFCSIRNLTTELGELKKENSTLLAIVLSHRNKLDILLDGFNQIDQEEAYKQFHKELLEAISFKESLWRLWLPVAITLAFILPANFSTTAIIFSMVLLLTFLGGYPLKYLASIVGIGIVAFALFILLAKATNQNC